MYFSKIILENCSVVLPHVITQVEFLAEMRNTGPRWVFFFLSESLNIYFQLSQCFYKANF